MADLDNHQLPGLAADDWEAAFASYDAATYQTALDWLRPDDVVLDIGAGDLRFARLAAPRVRRVIAVERRWELLAGQPARPANLLAVCAEARSWPVPAGVTVAVLLMRHCRHFGAYAARLAAGGGRRLITNARWGMAVELIDLTQPRLPFAALALGWYACACGAVGFVPGPADQLTQTLLTVTAEVADCPRCRPAAGASSCA